jgi:hypothetical protein
VRFDPLENDEDSDVAVGTDPALVILKDLVQPPTDSGSKALVSQDGKSITYTPGNRFCGKRSLVYRARDPFDGQAEARSHVDRFSSAQWFLHRARSDRFLRESAEHRAAIGKRGCRNFIVYEPPGRTLPAAWCLRVERTFVGQFYQERRVE